MKILVLSPDYPDDRRSAFSFVKQLVDEMATQGHDIQVIAPYSLTRNRRLYKKIEKSRVGAGSVTLFRPRYLSYSHLHVGSLSLTSWSISQAFQKGLRMLDEEPDVVYGHFWTSAYQGYHYAKEHNKPLFAATGESEIDFVCNTEEKKSFCDYVSGVICVSTKNLEESLTKNLTAKEKCVVIPNAIDANLFKLLDKSDCRKRLGLPQDVFIVAFVGWFNDRKGSERVSKAISKINGPVAVNSIFVGEGQLNPDCENVLFKGRLAHSQIPEYLNAADIFVLPTLQEGCCNAVIEAMACGLPIVSSNLPFNWDVLDESNSIMVNPNNIDEIAGAIEKLRDDKILRVRLSQGALKRAEGLAIDQRAVKIIDFIKDRLDEKEKNVNTSE